MMHAHLVISEWPLAHAACSGVHESASFRLMEAPVVNSELMENELLAITTIVMYFCFLVLALLTMSGEDPDHGQIVVEDRLVQG